MLIKNLMLGVSRFLIVSSYGVAYGEKDCYQKSYVAVTHAHGETSRPALATRTSAEYLPAVLNIPSCLRHACTINFSGSLDHGTLKEGVGSDYENKERLILLRRRSSLSWGIQWMNWSWTTFTRIEGKRLKSVAKGKVSALERKKRKKSLRSRSRRKKRNMQAFFKLAREEWMNT